MKYHDAVAFVESLSKITKRDYMSQEKQDRSVYLKRLGFLLDEIGHPELSIPNYIHITGTSGKGTVTMTLADALLANKKNVGAYNSPHITTTAERYWHNGKIMSARKYAELVEWIKPALSVCIEKSPYGMPSYFEIQVALAFEFFKREKCEWVVLEVGCGGEFDATNVIPAPRAAVITNIGLDHTHILGNTKTEIARTKSKIIKRDSQVFTAEASSAIRKIIRDEANRQGPTFTYVEGGNEELVSAVMSSLSRHLRKDPFPPEADPPSEETKFMMTRLPGRFEILQHNPLIILDVAHNPDKIAYLARNWREKHLPKPRVLFAAAENKNHRGMLKPLVELAREIVFVPFHSSTRECANPAKLERVAMKLKPSLKTSVMLSSTDGLEYILSKTKNEPILITGSFFLAADLRPRWISEAEILRAQNSFGSRVK